MSQRILAISHAIILFHTSGILSQSTPTTSALPSFTSSTSSSTESARPNANSQVEIFWQANWKWFLIGLLAAVVPILFWAILGPGRRWYKGRRYRSAPIQWDRVGNERFQSPSMREIAGFQKSRGSGSGSSTSSRLALSINAAAPGEQDIETAAAIASPKSPSTYIQRERRIRSDSSEAVIGLVQPQIHSPKPRNLMPPNQPADRNSTGSLGPPDPHVHRAHPKYNTFQRYSRQHKKRHMSMLAQASEQNIQTRPSNADIRQESMDLLQTQILHRKPQAQQVYQQRGFVPTVANMRTSQQIFLPQPPRPTPYHIRQGSYPNEQGRAVSWHHTMNRGSTQSNPYGLHSRQGSGDGYHPISEPMTIPPVPVSTPDNAPRRSISRGRLQKPQYMNPRSSSYHTHQNQMDPQRTREEPRMSFYRMPQPSRESLGRPRASSNPSFAPDVPPVPLQPTYPKAAYPAKSAMSSKVYGTESGYSYSISGGNSSAKSVKFAALPQLSSSAPARLPIHF
ncbi:hypothetical protein TWF481_003896 [Arthrobotrys musiformis]|uniref:Uncharacterized protein n=1 Tax=Arthrobotrys musiformis TaxID=47236 RepID=A0AAV9WI07_9PEZI